MAYYSANDPEELFETIVDQYIFLVDAQGRKIACIDEINEEDYVRRQQARPSSVNLIEQADRIYSQFKDRNHEWPVAMSHHDIDAAERERIAD